MAVLATQTIDQNGLTPAFTAAAAGGDKMPWGANKFLVVKNGSGVSVTVTIVTPGTVAGLAIADQTVTVLATTEQWMGPFGPDFKNADDEVDITYSAVTTVTVGTFAL